MKKLFSNTRRVALGLAIGAMSFAASGAQADVSFEGETVEWIIPFNEGGGSDRWARFYAPFLSEALPGKPTVAVINMPGAGSTRGANHFAQRVDPDGLTIFGSGGSTQLPYLLGDPRVEYEYSDWSVVLVSSTGGVVYTTPEISEAFAADPVATMAENIFLLGSQGASRLDLVPLLGFEMLGLDARPVFGISGRGEGRLMFERGEANIDWQTSSGYLSRVVPLVEQGLAAPLFSFGAVDANGNIVRDPTFPDIPTFVEILEKVKGEASAGPEWEAWKAFFVAGFSAQKMVFLPKGTSDEIVAAYKSAFEEVVANADFIASSGKELGVYPQGTGETAETQLKLGTTISEDTRAWVINWLREKFNVDL